MNCERWDRSTFGLGERGRKIRGVELRYRIGEFRTLAKQFETRIQSRFLIQNLRNTYPINARRDWKENEKQTRQTRQGNGNEAGQTRYPARRPNPLIVRRAKRSCTFFRPFPT